MMDPLSLQDVFYKTIIPRNFLQTILSRMAWILENSDTKNLHMPN